MFKLPKLSKKERAWVLYDVANSAFILTVITIFFPILYKMVYMSGIDPEAANYDDLWTIGSQKFKYLTSFLALTVAIISPVIGSWSNYKGNKKKFFKIFLAVAMIGGVGLAIPAYGWVTLLTIFFITSVGYNLTNVLYDAFLVDITTEDRMDEVSATGYGWGYIGSLIPFFFGLIPYALVLFGIIPDGFLGLPLEMLQRVAIGFSFIVSILWWLYYSLPLLKEVDQTYSLEHTENNLGESLRRLAKTFKEIRQYKYIFLFLISYLLYIDVVNSVIRLATNIGGDLKVGDMVMLGVVVLVQVIAFPSAIIYGRLTKKFGSKNMIFYGIFIYALGVLIVFMIRENTTWLMWVVGALIGTAQGGIQSVSRSYFAKMVPTEKANDFFGFFSVFGRFAGIFSPFIIAFFQDPDRLGINGAVLLLLVPLAVASAILWRVKDQKVEYVG